jgi:hypothetical protein
MFTCERVSNDRSASEDASLLEFSLLEFSNRIIRLPQPRRLTALMAASVWLEFQYTAKAGRVHRPPGGYSDWPGGQFSVRHGNRKLSETSDFYGCSIGPVLACLTFCWNCDRIVTAS